MQIVLKAGGPAALVAAAGALGFAAVLRQQQAPATAAPVASAAPSGATLIEAEASPRGEVKEDAGASGGKYVRVTGDYQPLITAPVPKAGGDSFTVWARLRGTPAQLKGTPGGKQRELKWSWDKPAEFQWVRFGRFTRQELGESVVVIRSSGKDEGGKEGIDALLFAADDSYDPAKGAAAAPPVATGTKPDGTAFLAGDFQKKDGSDTAAPSKAGPVAVTVDWNTAEGVVTREQYSINLFAGFSPNNVGNKSYQENLAYMNPGVLRLHHAGKVGDSSKPEGLIDEKNRTWDRKKIREGLSSIKGAGKRIVVFNIPGFPSWMDADNDRFLDADQADAYAALLADLVRIVNVENKFGVTHWEITNELDARYYTPFHAGNGSGGLKDPAKPDRWDEVAAIYNKCAVAMKKVDPTIKTGGPAAARPDLADMHERFIKATLPNLDFFSIHAYASGSAETPDQDVYNRADLMGRYVKAAVERLDRLSPKRKVPVMLGEYNVSWTWETRDPRMVNHKGGVFDALVMVSGVEAGAYSLQAWNEKDGIYGKTDGEDVRRPGAEVFHLFNTYLVGTRAKAESADEKAVVAYAVVDKATKHRSLLLVNRTDAAREVDAKFTGRALAGKPYLVNQVAGEGLKTQKAEPLKAGAAGRWTVPPHSVTVLTFAD